MNTKIAIGPGAGAVSFNGNPDESIHGTAAYIGFSGGAGLPGVELGGGYTYYEAIHGYEDYRITDERGRRNVKDKIITDIIMGKFSPVPWLEGGIDRHVLNGLRWFWNSKGVVQNEVYIYRQINYYSYGEGQNGRHLHNKGYVPLQ